MADGNITVTVNARDDEVQALLRGAEVAYENPMIDRDPIATWRDGPVALMGDAAHPMLQYFAQGACMAIEDAAVLARCAAEQPTAIDAAFE